MSQGRIHHTTSAADPPGQTGATSTAEAALATVRDVTAELLRLVRTTATQATDGWTLASVARSISPTLERMFAEQDALAKQADDLRARLNEVEIELTARQSSWRAERTALETDVAREHEQVLALTEEAKRRTNEIDLLAARERRLREQMETVAARANADREETLKLAREMVQSAEEARFAVVEEMETLRSALAAEQARLVEIQHERTRATQGAAERDAELARAHQIVEQLEASRASASAELARARTTLMNTENELLSSQHEYQLAQVQIEKLCGAHDDMIEDRAHLVARLHDAKEREARLRLRIAGLEQRIQEARGGEVPAAPEPAGDVDSAASALATELSRAEERTRALERELAAAKAAGSAAATRIADLQAQARAADVARTAAAAEVEALRSRLDVATLPSIVPATPPPPAAPAIEQPDPIWASSEAVVPEVDQIVPDDEPAELLAAAEEIPVPDEETVAEEVVATEILAAEDEPADEVDFDEPPVETFSPTPDADPAPEPAPTARALTILDAAEPWQTTEPQASFVPLGPEAGERASEITADVCVVNLATPGVLATAAILRAAGLAVPFWACAIAADGDRAWSLGPFDVVVRPIDPEAVRRQLAPLAPAGGNVIMVGSESATQIPLRQGLLQAGMSVRTAWDRKQAGDLADAVQPDVVIVDLASEAAGGASLIIDLAARARPPLIVVVPGSTQQIEALESALAAHAAARGTIDRAALLTDAAAAR